jgi:DNA-binding NtrC family response regulator
LSAIIRVLNAAAQPKEFLLASGVCTIGAGGDADIVVDDRTMSRRHAELELVPEGVCVRDLGSRNGTFYLGQRIREATLQFGSRIRLAKTDFALDADMQVLCSPDLGAVAYGDMRGTSRSMRQLFATLRRLEGSLASVLIQGESGTGKELIARALHRFSKLASGPFVAVNCGALERSLARSELFGHRKGAFTGATESQAGLLEEASGGTLFLDEIAELPPDVQPVLLRALETRTVTRIGETQERPFKARVISATHSDLLEDVRARRFRDDLYHRVVVVKLVVPPLRERPEDIPALIEHFARELGLGALPQELVDRFAARPWPGNARELRNAVEAFAAIGSVSSDASSEPLLESLLEPYIDLKKTYPEQREHFLSCFLDAYVKKLLRHTSGNQSEASRVSGMDRSQLNRIATRLRNDGPKQD